jgi:UDP-2,3-diacylglucosamine hydrolase
MKIQSPYKAYFISDVHLGAPSKEQSLLREKKLVSWLDSIDGQATHLFILGDLFDMWFDYTHVVPRGYTRLLGKLAQMSDNGLQIHFFTGNHDMWVFDYFNEEFGAIIHREPQFFEFDNLKVMMGHGDGLGAGDYSYKFIKKIFSSPINQWLFARLHPNFGLGIANYFSRRSRIANGNFEEYSEGIEKEFLVNYCREMLDKKDINLFVFGHRHIALDYVLSEQSRYINLGEWVMKPHIGLLENGDFKLLPCSNSHS